MNPFDVEWPPPILSDLADIWTKATNRQAVTDASDAIDDLLSRDPINNGVHISEGLYRLVAPPLVVCYEVDAARRRVKVSRVWYRP